MLACTRSLIMAGIAAHTFCAAQDITIESLPDPALQRQEALKELWELPALDSESEGAGLEVAPDHIIFDGFEGAGKLRIRVNGRPATEDAITGLRFEEHTYIKEMFDLAWTDTPGIVRVSPVKGATEAGTYTLSVYAVGEKETVTLELALPGEPLRQRLPREDVRITLPEEIELGRRIRLTLQSDPARRYVWLANGERVRETEGIGMLDYVARETGLLTLGLREYEGADLVASWDGATMVAEAAPLEWRVGRGAAVSLTPEAAGIAEYAHYRWILDGQPAGESGTFEHHFTQPGLHALTVIAEEPADPENPFAFREVTWKVIVEE